VSRIISPKLSEMAAVGASSFRLPFIFRLWHSPAHEPIGDKPTPYPPRRGTGHVVLLPSWEGLGGAWSQCPRKNQSRLSMKLSVLLPASRRRINQRTALPTGRRRHVGRSR